QPFPTYTWHGEFAAAECRATFFNFATLFVRSLMSIAFLSLVLGITPNTLCIGDSITQGWVRYTDWQRPSENCRSSRYFLEKLDQWQQGKHWSVIIFNCGIHDIQNGVPIEEYKANLHAIIHRLHADRIYFCNSTPGREHEVHGVEPEKIDQY